MVDSYESVVKLAQDIISYLRVPRRLLHLNRVHFPSIETRNVRRVKRLRDDIIDFLSSMAAVPTRAATLVGTHLRQPHGYPAPPKEPDLQLEYDRMAVTDSVKETAESVTESVKDAVGLGGSSGGSSGGPATSK